MGPSLHHQEAPLQRGTSCLVSEMTHIWVLQQEAQEIRSLQLLPPLLRNISMMAVNLMPLALWDMLVMPSGFYCCCFHFLHYLAPHGYQRVSVFECLRYEKASLLQFQSALLPLGLYDHLALVPLLVPAKENIF